MPSPAPLPADLSSSSGSIAPMGMGPGMGPVRCPAGPPSPSAAQKAPLPPFGPRRSPEALRGGCSPCPDPWGLLLLWGDPKRGWRRGMPVFGSPQPPASGSCRQQLRATRTHPTFSRELPPQAGNRAPLSGGDRAGGPGAPVPAHKEPLERAGTPRLKALRILQRPFDSGFVTRFFFFFSLAGCCGWRFPAGLLSVLLKRCVAGSQGQSPQGAEGEVGAPCRGWPHPVCDQPGLPVPIHPSQRVSGHRRLPAGQQQHQAWLGWVLGTFWTFFPPHSPWRAPVWG